MEKGKYIVVNKEVLDVSSPVLFSNNRSFRYGDGLFETIRFANNKIQFLEKHLERLNESMKLLSLESDEPYTKDFFTQEINKLIEKNNIEKGARIRITVFRNEGGFYTPHENKSSFLIECDPIEESYYNLNPNGLIIDIFSDFKKPVNKLSSIKSNNALIYVLAGVYRKANNLDDCVILNQNFGISEAVSSNIFAVKNGVLYTPPVADGCVNGIMRKHIISLAKENRISVYEVSLAMNVLLNSDELFLTNAIHGIKWVGAYKTKKFENKMAKQLVDKLNESLI